MPATKKRRRIFDNRKFILSVGDEGAILILMAGKKLIQRHFIESPTSGELANILKNTPEVPLYMLIDVLDQAYIQHTLPPVSPINIGQLVKRRLEKDFADENIKTARKLYREKEGRKDWNYSFISVHNAPPFSEWLDAAIETDNTFKGIYLLPIESENFIRKLNAAFIKKQKKVPEWQLLVSHNKVGGFRQIVYRDVKVLFTRIAQPIGGQAPDVIAGNIEQEVLNTIEYVRRLGFDNDENLDIFIIASNAVKTALETNALRAKRVVILTPEEIANKLGLENTAEKSDRFGDVVIASSFAQSRPILKFSSPYTQKVEQIAFANAGLSISVGILVPTLIFLSIMTINRVFKIQDNIELAIHEKGTAQDRLDKIMVRRGELPENSDQVLETVDIYKALLKEVSLPMDFIKQFAEIRTNQVVVKKIDLSIEESIKDDNIIRVTFGADFINPSKNIDRLLEDLDNFTQLVRKKFDKYNVSFSGLPSQDDNLSLGTNESGDGKNFEITIEGPSNKIKSGRDRRRRRR